MFLYDNWYMAAFSADLPVGVALARRICDKPVVLFRTEAGEAVALEDRCSHRAAPLSLGKPCGSNRIQCPYHGIEFDQHGTCKLVPGQEELPRGGDIAAYPLVERNTQLWIWVGDPAKADPSLVPVFDFDADPEWACTWDMFEYQASAELVIDNLLDMSHVAFVHTSANGDSNAVTNADMRVRPTERGVEVVRHMPNCEPPNAYRIGHDFTGKIDRWQEFAFIPGVVTFWTGGIDAGTGAFEGSRDGGVQLRHVHAITPSSPTTCYYHFINARNYGLNNEELARKAREASYLTIAVEDRPLIEAQQRRILDDPERKMVDLRADAPGLQARRIVRKLIAEQDRKLEDAAMGSEHREKKISVG